MAENTPTPSRRSLLAVLAALPGMIVPSTPAVALTVPFSAVFNGGSWSSCIAEYQTAALALKQEQASFKAVEAACKAEYGKIVVPAGIRSPFAKVMGWFDMSLEELREDKLSRRQGPTTPKKIAAVERDLLGVPEFKAAQKKAMAPRDAAWEKLDAASTRFSDAEDKLRDYRVRSVAELAEKMAIARQADSDWIMEGAHEDVVRLAGGLN